MIRDHQNDEPSMDFFQLFSEFYKKRWFILKVSAVCTIMAVAISFILKPQFQVRTYLTHPKANQYEKLNLTSRSKYTPRELFMRFVKKLSQEGNVISFLQDNKEISNEIKNLNITSPKKLRIVLHKLARNYKVLINSHDKHDTRDNYKDSSIEAELITLSSSLDLTARDNQNYIAYTNQKVLNDIIAEQRAIVGSRINTLENGIAKSIAEATASRQNKIRHLLDLQSEKSYQIKTRIHALAQLDLKAREIKLKSLQHALKLAEATSIKNSITVNEVNEHGSIVNVHRNKSDLYLRGDKYLKNEIALTLANKHTLQFEKKQADLEKELYMVEHDQGILILKNRKDDSAYAKGIERKQIEVNDLKSLTFSPENVSTFSMDSAPIIDMFPIKPNKMLIIILGFMLGLIAASFIVLMQTVWATKPKRLSS